MLVMSPVAISSCALYTLTAATFFFFHSQLCSALQMFGTVPVVIFQVLSPLFTFRSAAFDLHFLTFSLSPSSSILTIVFTLQLFPLLFAITQNFLSQPPSAKYRDPGIVPLKEPLWFC